jgi:hypothetical protein
MASKCYLIIKSYSSTSNPHAPSELSPSTGTRRSTSGGRRDSPLKRDTGASTTWSSRPRPSPSPAAPELAPGTGGPAADAAALLFLPPALSLVHLHPALYALSLVHLHPALYLPASILVLLTPARNSASLPAPPRCPPPTATMTPTTGAASTPRWTRRRRRTGRGPPSPCRCCPHCPQRGGRGAEHCTLSLPGSRRRSVRYLRTVIPRRGHPRRGIVGAVADPRESERSRPRAEEEEEDFLSSTSSSVSTTSSLGESDCSGRTSLATDNARYLAVQSGRAGPGYRRRETVAGRVSDDPAFDTATIGIIGGGKGG